MDHDDLAPEDLSEWAAALAMIHGAGPGGPVGIRGVLDGRPDLARRFARLDPINAAATFGGLLTVSAFQASGVRLEMLAHLALAFGRGKGKLDDKLAADAFRFLGEGVGRMEDPAEDVFVGAVRSPWGNFRVLEGLWEGGTFHLQRFVDVVANMPDDHGFEAIRATVLALLRVSDAVCARAGLERHQLGAEMPVEALPKRALPALLLRRRHLRFTARDLNAIGVNPDDLLPFFFDMDTRSALSGEALGASSLERFPIIASGGEVHLVLPTAVSSAIRYFVVAETDQAGLKGALMQALALNYSQLFTDTALLGGARPREVRFAPGPNGAFAEAMMQAGVGRFIHFVFFTDPLDELAETGLAGVAPASMAIGEELDLRIGRARRSVADDDQFRGGLTVVVGCGIGRGAAVAFGQEDLPDWRVVSCPAYDLITLSWTPDFTPENLWRMLDARDLIAALGARLHNVNGLINLVAWARGLDGHLVPHGSLPDAFAEPGRSAMLTIDQNRHRELRHESAVAFDPRAERFVDGGWIPVRKDSPSIFADDKAAPFYASEEPGPSGRPMSVFLAPKRAWWADVESSPGTGGDVAYERWRTVGVWLARAAPVLDALAGLPDGPLLWRVAFERTTIDRHPPETPLAYDEARAAIRVEVDRAARTITTWVGEAFERAQFHPLNIAERALVATFVRGAAELAGHADPAATELALTPRIVVGDQARHGHAFAVRGFRDLVRPDLRGRVVTISLEDDALMRLGLGWSVRDRAAGARLAGDEECRPFLNALVRRLEDDLVADLRRFDRRSMLQALLRNHELAVFDRDLWQRTSAAMIGLHGSSPDTVSTITDHEMKLNAVFQGTRILIEIALCECPLDTGLRPAPLDLSLLTAKAGLLVHVGGWSDAMRWGLMRPELRITPLGDVHADLGFLDEIFMPHGRFMSESRIAGAVEAYAENMRDRPVEASVAHRLDPVFADAWEEQFGATFDQTRTLIEFIEGLGEEAGKAMIAIPRSRLNRVEVAGQRLDDAVAARLVDLFTLATRPSWREPPDGFPDRDRHPWRYRRRLSPLRRPLLRIDDAADPTILVAPGMVRDAVAYMLGNYLRGDFPDYQLSPKMKAWTKRSGGERGTVFAKEVAAALAEAGWRTEIEVKVTKLLSRGLDRDYGDVDVLAWRPDTSRVLIIECKDVQFRKTFGEIAEQLADFRGDKRENGKPDLLLKHLDRMDVIRRHLDAVSRFTEMPALADVESHLMFRHPVPMEFALKRLAEKVTVSRFDRIDGI